MSHVRGKGSAEFDSIRIGQRPSIEATCRLLPGIGAGIGGRDSCVTHRACADDDGRRSLGGGRLRSYGAPSCFPDRDPERRLIHHPHGPDAHRGRSKLRRQRRCSATDGPARSCVFIPGSRTKTRRQVAGHSPSALCPIVASCIVIIHNKKRWRKWAGRCPARQYL